MSKTERDLAADGSVDALDELFDDADFDDALDAALEEADVDVPNDESDADAELDDARDDADDDARDDADDIVDHEVPADDELADDEAVDLADDGDETERETAELDDADELDGADEPDEADQADGLDEADEADELDEVDAESAELDDDSGDYQFPEIVPATPDGHDDTDVVPDEVAGDVEAFVEEDLDADEVAEEILEELRRADIDGPQVEMAPQDDTTAARRRPRRAVDYDPAPMPIPTRVPRVLARKPRVRKVTRVVRHVDPWSVFKIAIVAHLVLYIIVLTAGVLLWNVAHATGTVDNVERFFESFGWQSFEFNGGEIYHAAWIAGLFLVIGLTGMAVLLGTLFNLITDLVGGVRFTVLEEEVVETRTSPLRRFVVRRPEPEVPVTLADQSGPLVREAVVDDTSANERPSR